MHVHPPAYVCIINEKEKRQIPWRISRGLNWDNENIELKRSIHGLSTTSSPHFLSRIVEWSRRERARVGWFSRTLAFHLLYRPWGCSLDNEIPSKRRPKQSPLYYLKEGFKEAVPSKAPYPQHLHRNHKSWPDFLAFERRKSSDLASYRMIL